MPELMYHCDMCGEDMIAYNKKDLISQVQAHAMDEHDTEMEDEDVEPDIEER